MGRPKPPKLPGREARRRAVGWWMAVAVMMEAVSTRWDDPDSDDDDGTNLSEIVINLSKLFGTLFGLLKSLENIQKRIYLAN